MKSSELSGRQRLPIIPSILRQIRALWSTRAPEFDIVMLWAACCTAFFGFFRMGEIMSATTKGQQHDRGVMVDDVAVDNPHKLSHYGENPFEVLQYGPIQEGGRHLYGKDRRRFVPGVGTISVSGHQGQCTRPAVSAEGWTFSHEGHLHCRG